jgi:hypothetical protein
MDGRKKNLLAMVDVQSSVARGVLLVLTVQQSVGVDLV